MIDTAALAADLHAAVDEALRLFERIDRTRTSERQHAGTWCAREVLGHLVDSACNNHRRFVLGQIAPGTAFDGYDQDAWVRVQRYDAVPWADLVALWSSYNRHLAHVIASSEAPPPALGALMEDYVVHLRHHVAQIRARMAP